MKHGYREKGRYNLSQQTDTQFHRRQKKKLERLLTDKHLSMLCF